MRRHPLDTCLSCYEASFAFGLDYAARLESLGTAYRMYADLTDRWHGLPGIDVLQISYETLVTTPEPAVRAILDKAGLPWDPACLTPADAGTIKTASVVQARDRPHAGSIGRWERHADRLQPLVEHMGGMSWIQTRLGAVHA